jgi:hypothetical protein
MAYEDDIGQKISKEAEQMISERSTLSSHCDEVARLVLPTYKNTFFPYSSNTIGERKTEDQIDSTSEIALSRFSAIIDSLLTPRNSFWHSLEASNPDLQKVRAVRLWFEDTTRRLFRLRYAPTANFASQNHQTFTQLGAWGNGPMLIDKHSGIDGTVGFRYRAIPFGEVYLKENHQGIVDTFLRIFEMTAKQIVDQWGPGSSTPGKVPDAVTEKNKAGTDQTKYWVFHCVKPRTVDYDPKRLDAKGKKYASYYVIKQGNKLVWESGYNSFPLPTARGDQAPGEPYGRGAAMQVLPAIKTLNAQKRIVLKQGHRTVDPVLFTHDDGIASISMKPGALNVGGVNASGQLMVQPLPIGNVMIGKDLMDDERAVINDAFLVNLFQVLLNDPKVLTATQVVEMANQKGILLAPTVGRQQSDYVGPMIERELDLGLELGLFLPMPRELIEAKGDYQIVYTSPMARIAKAEENAGFIRSLETTLQIVNITQDPSALDRYNFDVAIPEMAINNGTPERWMNGDDVVAQKQQARAAKAQAEMDIQAGPAAAAMMKASAVAKGGKAK